MVLVVLVVVVALISSGCTPCVIRHCIGICTGEMKRDTLKSPTVAVSMPKDSSTTPPLKYQDQGQEPPSAAVEMPAAKPFGLRTQAARI